MTEIATRDTGAVSTVEPLSEEFMNDFPALAEGGGEEFVELLAANLGSDDVALNLGDFVRIKIPTGGMTQWMVPNPDTGEEDATRSITGIIVTMASRRSYWPNKEMSGAPPACRSVDLKIGEGTFGPGSEQNPAGTCSTCPMSQRGSMASVDPSRGDSLASACKEQRLLFLLPRGELLPWMVTVSPGSLAALRKFMLQRVTLRRKDYRQLYIKLSLEKVNGGGNDYARIVFDTDGVLAPAEYAAAKNFGAQLAKLVEEQADVVSDVVDGVATAATAPGVDSEPVDYDPEGLPQDEVDLSTPPKARKSR